MRTHIYGKGLFLPAILIMVAMAVVSFFLIPQHPLKGELGLCLPSPNTWDINLQASWIINTVAILAIGVAALFLNRRLNFIKHQDYLLPAGFIVMTASIPWLTYRFSSPMLLALVNFICLSMMLENYKQRNCTQNIFVIATLLSVGSMVQYGFLFMVPLYILVGIVMKSFRFRESIAMLLGLFAPYWVGVGTGLIPIDAFRMPTFTNLFDGFASEVDLLVVIVNVGVTALVALMLGLNNSMILYAGNPRIRACNNAIALMGLVCMVCIIVDFNNMLTYLPSFYFSAAAQLASLFALRPVGLRSGRAIIILATIMYISSFLLIGYLPV